MPSRCHVGPLTCCSITRCIPANLQQNQPPSQSWPPCQEKMDEPYLDNVCYIVRLFGMSQGKCGEGVYTHTFVYASSPLHLIVLVVSVTKCGVLVLGCDIGM